MKKYFLLILFFIPFIVSAATFEPNYPNRYYGYFQTILYNNSNVMLSFYNNTQVEDDVESSLQSLTSGTNKSYTLNVSAFGIFRSGYDTGVYSALNSTDLHYWEQDLCLSSNDVSIHIRNGNVQDFTSNENPLVLVTSDKCKLYGNNVPDNVVGPKYWEWLSDYEGYIVKVFMPISAWHSSNTNDGVRWDVTSIFNIQNNSGYEIFYRFLTTGGLYDHSRYFEINDAFDLDTKNFDLTYDAIMNGVTVLDSATGLTYHASLNLFDDSLIQVGKAWNNDINNNRAIIIIPVEPNTYYTISFLDISLLDGVYAFGRANKNDSTKTFGNYDISGTRTIRTTAESNYLGLQFNKTNISKQDIINARFQVQKGKNFTSYCPFGPTLDISCYVNNDLDIIIWDSNNIFNNFWNILTLPLKLGGYVAKGCSGQCNPLIFTLFNTDISVPCGGFFWDRPDVADFRTIWNMLFGGIIIFRLLIWMVKLFVSTLDPTADNVGTAVDLIDTRVGRRGD